MSISSDFTKATTNVFSSSQSNQIVEQEFSQIKQRESQVVRQMADIDKDTQEKAAGDDVTGEQGSKASGRVDNTSVEQANLKLRQLSVGLSFEITDDGQENIVKVIDQDTGDLVRQIPSEEFIAMSKRLDDIFGELNDLKGNLINNQA